MERSSVVEEHGVKINTGGTVLAPKKGEIMYNPEMAVNRSVVLSALAAYVQLGQCVSSPVRCLDALGATGVAGLAWAQVLPQVRVTINDQVEAAAQRVRDNAATNGLQVEVTSSEVSSLLLQRPFDFIFLDCYGSSVQYLESAFRNAPKHGLLAITSTDDAALYGKAPDVTLRQYAGHIIKTSYAKELAARLVLAAVVRAGARCNKGVEVVGCVAVRSFVTVLVRVLRGPAAANRCVRNIRRLIHCCMCEDRAFYPDTVYPIEDPYALLSCECRSRSVGKVAVELGPVWCDAIFDPTFCQAMLTQAQALTLPHRVISRLQMVVNEANCRDEGGPEGDKENSLTSETGQEEEEEEEEEEGGDCEEGGSSPKRAKTTHPPPSHCPPFYFNLHRHSPKGHDLGKINKVVEQLRQANHKASRTHFDPEAVRTSCCLKEFTRLLLQFSQSLH